MTFEGHKTSQNNNWEFLERRESSTQFHGFVCFGMVCVLIQGPIYSKALASDSYGTGCVLIRGPHLLRWRNC